MRLWETRRTDTKHLLKWLPGCPKRFQDTAGLDSFRCASGSEAGRVAAIASVGPNCMLDSQEWVEEGAVPGDD